MKQKCVWICTACVSFRTALEIGFPWLELIVFFFELILNNKFDVLVQKYVIWNVLFFFGFTDLKLDSMNIACEKAQIRMNNSSAPSITEIANMPGVAQNLTEKWTYPEGMPDSMTFDLFVDDVIIGQAAFKSMRWFNRKAELSLFIHPEYQGKKIGTSVLKAMISHAFNHLNLHRLEAEVIAYNIPGIKLIERMGFVREGCLREARFFEGKYHDIFRFGLLKSEYGSV